MLPMSQGHVVVEDARPLPVAEKGEVMMIRPPAHEVAIRVVPFRELETDLLRVEFHSGRHVWNLKDDVPQAVGDDRRPADAHRFLGGGQRLQTGQSP